jgi:VWFA-related protein
MRAVATKLVFTCGIVHNDLLPRWRPNLRRIALGVGSCFFALLITTISTAAQSSSAVAPGSTPDSAGVPHEPMATFRSSTRMVTVEVVARDHDGRPIVGLTSQDFQVFEQAPGWRKEKHEQRIAAFRAIKIADFAEPPENQLQPPAGVVSNHITMQKNPVPPTILLIDGLNTDMVSQMQVHAQMVRMLHSLPSDVPVSVLLLGHRLRMLQSFTTDPALLKAALEKASTMETGGLALKDPHDDPDTLSAFLEEHPVGADEFQKAGQVRQMQAILHDLKQFEQQTYAANMDIRVGETLRALLSIARNLAGYPGRKNLLWISSSFPIALIPESGNFVASRLYQNETREVANALAEAKVAVYPIDPAGLGTQSYFSADTRPRANAVDSLGRESQALFDKRATMDTLADQTGGRVCVGDNDLGDCVRKAVTDSSAFYELAYYPTSTVWNGEFRKIIIKTNRFGLHLAYRQGYFARPEGSPDSKISQAELQQAACEDYLNATSILFAARRVPSDSPNIFRFNIAIDPALLNFPKLENGGRELKLMVAVCSFDTQGKPIQLMTDSIDRKLSAQEYRTILRMGGYPYLISMIPKKEPAAVRLLVKDLNSGHLGSVNVPLGPVTAKTN